VNFELHELKSSKDIDVETTEGNEAGKGTRATLLRSD
jgi:hypothetical protein